jgi:UTP--glucose-1-phosphate uridylyltransferase
LAGQIRKLIIPAAGLGTRLLPATKVIPKELIPVAGRPLIQFAVEEASASGIETVVLVTAKDKTLIGEHFSRDLGLENALIQRGKSHEAACLRALSDLAEIVTVCQEQPLGLADAIRSARSVVGEEPFAVILPDALIDSATPCIRQLIRCYERHRGCVVATQTVDGTEVDRYGILDVAPFPDACCGGRTLQVISLIERPRLGSVTSRYGIFGRYILEPEIFACIDRIGPGFNGELQLTDALCGFAELAPIYAYHFEGEHYDAGNKLGLLKAALAYGLKDPEVAESLRAHLCTLGPIPATTLN